VKRRQFITLLGGAAAAWPLAARAQQGERARRIGVLMGVAEGDPDAEVRLQIFRDTLRTMGWTDGHNVQFIYRWAAADAERRRTYAVEMVSEAPDVILADSAPVTATLKAATKTIPIVFGSGGDPVAAGLVTSLARPGGNVTGFSLTEPSLGGKWLSLLHELAQQTTRIAVVFAPENPVRADYSRAIDETNASLRFELTALEANNSAQIAHDIRAFAGSPGGALLVLPGPSTIVQRDAIIAAALVGRLPAIYPFRSFVRSGGLMAYGPDLRDTFRRAATYVDRILRGEQPSNLPVQQPIKFELIINLRAAQGIDLNVPPALLARADEVIE
jgi:ABC-type uncharacterized transport system substrate-binding protein